MEPKKTKLLKTRRTGLVPVFLLASGAALAQQATPTPPAAAVSENPSDEEVIELTPFEVSSTENTGYMAATTIAGNRLNTELRDIGNAVSVVTTQFMKDIGATDSNSLLQYTVGTEVGNAYGNFAGYGDGATLDEGSKFTSNSQNRVRGLTSADNSRDYFLTSIPWDSYNVDGVDLQRGPNSILFGQGSPAGLINIRTKQAAFKDSNEITARFGSFGSYRGTVDFNRVLVKNELAIRVAAVHNDEKYKQDPAYEKTQRVYGALRYEPSFLKKGGNRTIIKGNIEFGKVNSNRPRQLPPIDAITPWFYTEGTPGYNVQGGATVYAGLNRSTYIPSQLQDDNTGLPNHGQMRPSYNGGPNAGQPNLAYQPWLGNFAQQFGGPLAYFNSTSSDQMGVMWAQEPRATYGIGPNGQVDGSNATPFQRPASVAAYSSFAKNAHLPYSNWGIYKDKSLTDASVFDFYNHLLEGPNKSEWQNFRTSTLTLSQTFLNDQLGFEVTRNDEHWKGGQLSLLSGGRQAIFVDVNSVYADGTATGANGEPYGDGTPNPNVGRAFVSDNGAGNNNETVNDFSTTRATAYATHNFERDSFGNPTLRKILGNHTFTGLLSRDEQESYNRSWQRYAVLDSAYERLGNRGATPLPITDNFLLPNAVIYLGDSLANRTSASGAALPALSAVQTIASGRVRYYDSTWVATNVNPADPWENAYYPVGSASRTSTQSENPANYRGWTEVQVPITDSEAAAGNRDLLTTGARKTKNKVTSKAFVWQASTWDKFLVGTWGARQDISKSYGHNLTSNTATRNGIVYQTRGVVDLSKLTLPELGQADLNIGQSSNRVQVTSHAWTAVAHLSQAPYLGEYLKKLPVQFSVFYNESSNFQPASQRVDLYGTPLAAPSGKTVDKGILIETADGKYSLKINKYKTTAINASSNALQGAWFIGASQAWSANWVNRFQYNWTGDTNGNAVLNPDPTNTQYNYGPAPGESLAQAQAREASVISAWRTWQASVDPRFYQAWGINLNDPTKNVTASNPQGFTVTEDAISEGYEIELGAQPTKNWRVAINAAKSKATRTNIGGEALSSFVAAYQAALNRGAPGSVGDLRIWWGGPGNETALQQWNNNIGSEFAQRRLQEGTAVPELREWRLNAITNYDFDQGWAKGINVGGGIRYESSVIIGYPPLGDPAGDPNFDLSSPYKGPSETNYDFWVGYSRKLTSKINWNIQLNVRNAFVGNELIPISVQPDGSPAAYRIRPPQVWQITNTFTF